MKKLLLTIAMYLPLMASASLSTGLQTPVCTDEKPSWVCPQPFATLGTGDITQEQALMIASEVIPLIQTNKGKFEYWSSKPHWRSHDWGWTVSYIYSMKEPSAGITTVTISILRNGRVTRITKSFIYDTF